MAEKKEASEFDDLVKNMEAEVLEKARELYTSKTLEEAYNPKNVGELKTANGAARITGPCGDTQQIQVSVEGNRIVDCTFITDGCGASTACGSVATELVKGKTIEEALAVEDGDILAVLGGLPADNIHCATLAVDTLRAALEDYKNRNEAD